MDTASMFSQIGGARLDWTNVTIPFARLSGDGNGLRLSCLGRDYVCILEEQHRTLKPVSRHAFNRPAHRAYRSFVPQIRCVLGFRVAVGWAFPGAQRKIGVGWVQRSIMRRLRSRSCYPERGPRTLDG